MIKRTWRLGALAVLIVTMLVAGCTQAGAPAVAPAQKPVEKAAEKAAEKPAEKAEAKPAASKGLPSTIGIGTLPTGSQYFNVATGVAKVASDHSPIKVLVKPFAGPNAWMPVMEKGELELGVLSGMDAAWAYRGQVSFPTPNKNLRVLVRGNQIPMAGFTVRNDSDIKSVKDVRGKRVASEFGGNVMIHLHMTAYLESVGLTWNDVKPIPVTDISTGLKALREGRADVAFGGSATTAGTLETDSAIGLRLLNFGDISPEQADNAPKEIVDRLQKLEPGASIFRLNKEGWLKSDAASFRYPIFLAAGASLSADAVYQITKATYENDKELHPVTAWLKDWQQKTMFDAAPPAPYHEGAIRFWKEKGLWTPEAEANQKKLLGQ
ncbi:MAG: TAXI family TRAP transporter solute-binding subunit [Chloroflexi bacterium]|nr:TAXI family TRAP transporter solute-binding subunit [Chloroflexota bacterium]